MYIFLNTNTGQCIYFLILIQVNVCFLLTFLILIQVNVYFLLICISINPVLGLKNIYTLTCINDKRSTKNIH